MLILIIEDDAGITELLAESLAEQGCETDGVYLGSEALTYLETRSPDLMILDYGLPDMSGQEFIETLKKSTHPVPPFIVATGQGDEQVAVEMMKLGARDYVVKDAYFLSLLPEIVRRVGHELENEQKLQQTEEKLRASEEKYRTLVEQSLQGVIIAQDNPVRLRFVSQPMQAILGFSPQELTSFGPEQLVGLIHPADRETFFGNFRARLAGQPAVSAHNEYRMMHKDGGERWVESYSTQIEYEGSPAVQSAFLDITERKQAEEALKIKDSAISSSINAIAMAGLDGNLTYVNKAFLKMWGAEKEEEVLGKPAISFWKHPEKAGEVVTALVNTGGWIGELSAKRQDGSIFYAQLSASMIFGANGNPLSMMSSFIDITERKRIEAINAARLHLLQFSTNHSLDELLEETLNEAEKLTGSLIGFYHFVSEDQKSLTLQTWSTRTKRDFCKAGADSVHYPIDEAGVWVDCVYQRKPVIHNNYASLPHRKGMPDGHAEVIRELVVPVFRGENISAILGVGNKSTDYTQHDVETISMLADLVWEIAERKRIEAIVDKFFEQPMNLHLVAGLDGLMHRTNKGWQTTLGYTRDELEGTNFLDLVHPDDRAAAIKEMAALEASKTTYYLENRYRHKNGTYRLLAWSAIVSREDKLIYAVASDITERKQATEALRKNEERYRRAQAMGHVGNWEYNIQTAEFWGSDEAKKIYGLDPEFVTFSTDNVESCIPERERVHQALVDLIERDQEYNLEFEIITNDTQQRKTIISIAELEKDAKGIPLKVTGVIHDITQRKQAEESLRLLNQAIEQSPVSVVITDTEGIIQYVNPKFCQVTGYSAGEAIGQNPRLLKSGRQSAAFYREMWDTLAAGHEWQGEFHNRKKNGKLYWELASIAGVKNQSGHITHYVAVKEDITERKQREEETVRQERLAAVGQLAAGIAHDFNNILTSIIGFADLLQHNPIVPKGVHPDLTKIVKQGQRAAKLTRQILDFSRQTVTEPHPLDLKLYLNETLKFIERTIPETIQIQFNFAGGDCTINADPAQLQQVITNLAVNARDAMFGNGTLYFDLSRVSVDADELPPCPEMKAGEWVRLAVTDTGNGIDSETLPHIFEPFFTTKEVGKGTGLGLAQIYGIIQQHNGCITVNSQVGQGTIFTLYFPALTAPIAVRDEAVETIPRGQGETILLVEDEQAVREVAHTMLEILNYRVITAKNGVDALAVYHARPDEIALVLTDVVMPDMDGFALASALHAETPGIKVILMSGYAARTPKIPVNITARLQKPLSIRQLAQALKMALD